MTASQQITETVTVDRFPTIDTFTFPGFADLTSVRWFQGPGGFSPGFGDHQFDNVSLLFIPEPASLWLLLVGAFTLMLIRPSSMRVGPPYASRGRLDGLSRRGASPLRR